MNIADLFTKVDTLSTDETKDILSSRSQDEVELIDVREPKEYNRGHIPGARLIPMSGIADNIDSIDTSKTVITYCQRGVRSRSAAALLKRSGFTEVFSMTGGIEAWNGNVASGEYEAGLYMIEGRKTVDELLSLAWGLEEGARIFYSRARDLVEDTDARDILSGLIQSEVKHKAFLLSALSRIKDKEMTDDIIKESSLDNVMEGGISVDKAIDWLRNQENSLFSVLELSMHLEANSLDLYMKMYNELENDETKKVFSGLIKEEKVHLAKLGHLLNEKAV